jgi:putative transposase
MARPLRLDYADTFYHVLSRGNERKAIFRDDADRLHFLDLLGMLSERFTIQVWAYVLMDNHYHLVLRTAEANLSQAMHWLGVSYSVWHNRRHGRAGHLFQGRFKSFIVDEEGYLDQLILYVHRNPLRARLVERLAAYRWSSYRPLAYGRGRPRWFDRERVLGLFGGAPGFRQAVRLYSEEEARLFEDLRAGLFLGSVEACERLLARAGLRVDGEQPQSKRLAAPPSVAAVVERHRRALGISDDALAELRRPVRGRERPLRDVLIYLAWRRGAFALERVGAYFGVGYTTVVNARKRGAERLRKSRGLRRKLRASNDK